MSAGRSAGRLIEPSIDADAGDPQGRTEAPRAMVIAGVVTALEMAVASTMVTAGSVSGQEDVPPTPVDAVVHEQPSADGKAGPRTAQTGPVEAVEAAVEHMAIKSMVRSIAGVKRGAERFFAKGRRGV